MSSACGICKSEVDGLIARSDGSSAEGRGISPLAIAFPWGERWFQVAVPFAGELGTDAAAKPAPGPASDDFRSSMADGRPPSRGSLAEPLASECMLPSLECGKSRVYEPALERGPFREYALPFFRLVSNWRSFWGGSWLASPLGQLVQRKVLPTELLSWDLRGESNERG